LGSILGDAMMLVLKIPEIFDDMMNKVNDKMLGFEKKIDEIKLAQVTASKPTVKPLPPPADPPKKDTEVRLKEVKSNTRQAIIQELKNWFDIKKNIDKNREK